MKNWNNQKQQIPTLEILPEGTKLTGVIAAIPVFLSHLESWKCCRTSGAMQRRDTWYC